VRVDATHGTQAGRRFASWFDHDPGVPFSRGGALRGRLTVIGSLVTILTNSVEPADYAVVLADLKNHVRAARFTAQRRANTELVHLD
jgi:hypothetical protein